MTDHNGDIILHERLVTMNDNMCNSPGRAALEEASSLAALKCPSTCWTRSHLELCVFCAISLKKVLSESWFPTTNLIFVECEQRTTRVCNIPWCGREEWHSLVVLVWYRSLPPPFPWSQHCKNIYRKLQFLFLQHNTMTTNGTSNGVQRRRYIVSHASSSSCTT